MIAELPHLAAPPARPLAGMRSLSVGSTPAEPLPMVVQNFDDDPPEEELEDFDEDDFDDEFDDDFDELYDEDLDEGSEPIEEIEDEDEPEEELPDFGGEEIEE